MEEHRMKPVDSSLVMFKAKYFVPASKREVEESRKAQILYETERSEAVIVRPHVDEALPRDGLPCDGLPRDGLSSDSLPCDGLMIGKSASMPSSAIQSLQKEVGKTTDSEKQDKHGDKLVNPSMNGQSFEYRHNDGRPLFNDRHYSTNHKNSTSPPYHKRRSDNYSPSPHYNDNTHYPTSTYRGRPLFRSPWRDPWINQGGERRWTDYNRHNRSPERTWTNNYSKYYENRHFQNRRSDKSPERRLNEGYRPTGNVISTSQDALKVVVGTANNGTLVPSGMSLSNETIDCEESNQILAIITPQVERSHKSTRMEPASKKLKRGNEDKRKNVEDDKQDCAKTQRCQAGKLRSLTNSSQTQGAITTNNKASTSSTSSGFQMEAFLNESFEKNRSSKFETGDSIKLDNQTKITDAEKRDNEFIQTPSVTDKLRISSLDNRIETLLKGDDNHATKQKEMDAGMQQNYSKNMKSVKLNNAICPSFSNDVTLSQPGTSVSSVVSRSDPLVTYTFGTKQTLRYNGVVEMLEILMNFPLPWLEGLLFKDVQKIMGHCHTTHLSNTLQIICKTSKVVQRIIGSMPSGNPMTPNTSQTEPSPTFPEKDTSEDIPTSRDSQESLNSEGLAAMLDTVKKFPLPWNQKTLTPVILRSLGKHSVVLVTNTLQIVCKTCNDVVRKIADQSETDD